MRHLKVLFTLIVATASLLSGATQPTLPDGCDPILQGIQSYDLALQANLETQIYAKGQRTARRLLRLTADEYVKLVLSEQIPPDVILVLDEMPLHVDLPMVAGILVGSPLQLEGTHIQVQAEKMDVPFAYIQDVFNNSAVRTLSQWSGYFTLLADQKVDLKFNRQAPPEFEVKRPKSVLPGYKPRGRLTVLSVEEVGAKSQDDTSSKFAALAKFPISLRYLMRPEILKITSAAYEEFLDSAEFEGKYLRKFIRTRMELVNQPGQSEEVVKLALSEIRFAIESAKVSQLFEQLAKAVRVRGLKLMDQVSVRSNNEIEDIIGAGVFSSAVAESATAEHLGKAIRSVWASMFTYRAYSIGRFWGLREENMSMPILLHKYIGDEKVNGTGRFTFNGESLELHLNLVYGDKAKATNPSAGVKVQQLVIGKVNGDLQILEGPLNLDDGINRSVFALYEDLESAVLHDFLKLRHQPQFIEIEFLVNANNRPVLLQYKKRLYRETVLALLKGDIKLPELERTVDQAASNTDAAIEMALSRNGIIMLHDFDFAQLGTMVGPRYALVAINGRYAIILWQDRMHRELHTQIKIINSNIVWLTGGNLNFLEPGKLFLSRSGGIYEPPKLEKVILALQNSLVRNSKVLDGIQSVGVEAKYPTDSPEMIQLPLKAVPQAMPATEKNRSLFDLFKGG